MHLHILRPFQSEDETVHPLRHISRLLLILPVFMVVALLAVLYLGITWALRAALRAGQLFLPNIK